MCCPAKRLMAATHLLRGCQSAPVVSKGQNWGKRRSGVSDRSGEESAGSAGFHSFQPHCCGSSGSMACSSFLLYKRVRGKTTEPKIRQDHSVYNVVSGFKTSSCTSCSRNRFSFKTLNRLSHMQMHAYINSCTQKKNWLQLWLEWLD